MLETKIASRRAALSDAVVEAAGAVVIRPLKPQARFAFRMAEEAAREVGTVAGFSLDRPMLTGHAAGDRLSLRLGPNEWLLIGPEADAEAIAAQIEAALAGRFFSLTDVGHRNVGIAVSGPEAATVLNAGCPSTSPTRSFRSAPPAARSSARPRSCSSATARRAIVSSAGVPSRPTSTASCARRRGISCRREATMISVFDLFKIGIGPSSSHTVGPMVAAKRFRDAVEALAAPTRPHRRRALRLAGLDRARTRHRSRRSCLGLLGDSPATIDPDTVAGLSAVLQRRKRIAARRGHRPLRSGVATSSSTSSTLLPRHSNGMRFRALDAAGRRSSTCLLLDRRRLRRRRGRGAERPAPPRCRIPFTSGAELLALCREHGLSIAAVQLANEEALRPTREIEDGLDAIRDAMFACIDRGLSIDGELPGGLKVKRRAKALFDALDRERRRNRVRRTRSWTGSHLSRIAVNEENASGGRVVTAPTNGAAGIVPAVLRYFRDFCPEYGGIGPSLPSQRGGDRQPDQAQRLDLRRRGRLPGRGRLGRLDGRGGARGGARRHARPRSRTPPRSRMEHHLGMTCDPIGGLVQIPCIERNAFGANKAIAAASLALRGDGTHFVSLDAVIETMRQTGADMQSKYKETSQGGLAVNVAEC